ncbi:fasciclin domain-containing protein [Lacibacter cauensis]|nr:fasciclin domain-containing protein [Lacibacter cauensis]
MKIRQTSLLLLAGLFSLQLLSSCSKIKDERNDVTDPALQQTLLDLVSANPQLSTFKEYLVKTGYDKIIRSSRNYTVFAPVNSALSSLDPAIVNDAAKLKSFVGNHIALQQYRTSEVAELTRIAMLNDKYNNMQGKKIEDANITVADKYAGNGLLQVIDKALPSLDNCWDFLSNNSNAPVKQKTFMLSLFRKVFDATNAVVVGINPNTGEPIYQAGTDSVFTNLFWNKVHDLRQEKKQFTLFMLADAAWDAEVTKYMPYYVTNTADSNTLVTSWNVVKDFAVDTVYQPNAIPDTVLSKFGTKLPVNKSAIVKTIKTSNGIVYIMSQMNVLPASKILEITVQGESYNASSVNRRSNTYFRDRYNTVTGKDFTDVLVFNHGVSNFWLRYDIPEVPSVKYKAYAVALNDFQTAAYTQRLGIGGIVTTLSMLVNPNVYSEVYIGEFTQSKYSPVFNLYLLGANSTTAAVNPLSCDYIKLVPSL